LPRFRDRRIGEGEFGVRIASLVAYLRATLHMPVRRAPAYLETRQRGPSG
jgi:hypothetical protein